MSNLCACGCGKKTSSNRTKYVHGHNNGGKKFSAEHKRKMSESMKISALGNTNAKGHTLSDAQKKKISERTKIGMKNMSKEKWHRVKYNAGKNKPRSEDAKRRMKAAQQKRWKAMSAHEKDEYFRKLKMRESPNRLEQYCIQLFEQNDIDLMFCGDGSKPINHKYPDFINEKKKVIIEVFYDYFKIKDYGSIEKYKERRRKIFKGWKCFFFNTDNVYDKQFIEDVRNVLEG